MGCGVVLSCLGVDIFVVAKLLHVFFVSRNTDFRTAFTNDARHLKVPHGENLSIYLIRRCCDRTAQDGSVWRRAALYGFLLPSFPVPVDTPVRMGPLEAN